MSTLSDLETIRDNLVAQYKSVSAVAAPDYQINGQRVDRGKFLEQLEGRIAGIRRLISQEEGPFQHQDEVLF